MASKKKKNTNTKEMKILLPTTKIKESVKCKNTKQAYKIFRDLLDYEEYELKSQEHFWIMGIDSAGYVVCVYIAAIGSENRMIIDPIDIFSIAIACKARKVFLAHNHPDDNEDTELKLSTADFDFTNKLYHACLPFGITILDHIILGDNIYYSFYENSYMAMIYSDKTHKSYQLLEPKLEEEKETYARIKELKGKQEGLVEGKEIGEHDKAVEMAEKMLAKKRPIDEIFEFTGLTVKDIYDIKGGVDYFIGVAKSMLADGLDISKVSKYTKLTIEAIKKIKKDMGLY